MIEILGSASSSLSTDLPIIAGSGSLVAFVIMAVIRVLTHDRDESSIINAWKARAEAEVERANRIDRENIQLRMEIRRLSNILIRNGMADQVPKPPSAPDDLTKD